MTTKRRKVDAECRIFHDAWTIDYFFIEHNKKTGLSHLFRDSCLEQGCKYQASLQDLPFPKLLLGKQEKMKSSDIKQTLESKHHFWRGKDAKVKEIPVLVLKF